MNQKELVCIVCPIGCRLIVEESSEGKLTISGNNCVRGVKYGLNEATNPTRVLPTTIKIKNGLLPRLPVRTTEAIPKDLIFKCMSELQKIEVEAPIKMNSVIVKNILDTGVDIIATRNMDVAQ